MADELQLKALHAAVNCYLSLVSAVADCLASSCPSVGGLYRHRLERMRTRLAFDSSPQALEESCVIIQEVLQEYAARASEYVAGHGVELRAGVTALEDIVWSLAERQEFYSGRLRQFAHQMEVSEYPSEPEHLHDVMALQAIGLMSCVESMSHVSESLMTRMHRELRAVERRVKDSEIADPLTGLLNRREMDLQIEACKASGEEPILLHFQVFGASDDDVMKLVSERLAGQFRHKDLVCRWTESEFMVLFRGPVEVARARSGHIVPWVAGRYPLATGEHVDVEVAVRLLSDPEPVVATEDSLTVAVL